MKTKASNKKRKAAAPKSGSKAKQQKKRIIATSIAVGAAGILGYFGWQYIKKKKSLEHSDSVVLPGQVVETATAATNPFLPVPTPAITKSTGPLKVAPTAEFPLKKGSKGAHVKKLQQALIAKHGAQILPKYGADGDFGSEVAAALKKLGLPAAISQSTFNVLAHGTNIDAGAIGQELYRAVSAKDYNKTLSLLAKLQSVEDYTLASEEFKKNRLGSVHQTLVNGLLSTFTSDSQKQKIRFELLRMGLQYDGSKWSLSGLGGPAIVTTAATSVWLDATKSVRVPARMVLGSEVSKRLEYTLFENGGRHFLVQTKSVKYL